MRTTMRHRLARLRESLPHAGARYGDWLSVVIRARLQSLADGTKPPSDEAILAQHWDVSEEEAMCRVQVHNEYIASHNPHLQALANDPDLPRRLAEVDLPIRPDETNPEIPGT